MHTGTMRISPSTANYYISLLLVGLLGSSIVFAMTPKEVALVSEVVVPIVADGKTIGSVKLKAGSLVTVISVQGDEVVISRGGGEPFKVAKEVIQEGVLDGFPRNASAPAAKPPTPSASPA